MQKTLIILRHGKAERARGQQEDHERPLAERGVREAGAMGAYLAARGLRPDTILCSTAMRTRQTCAHLFSSPRRGEAGWGALDEKPRDTSPPPNLPPVGGGIVEYADALYMASDHQLLKIIAAQPDDVGTLMIVGHNPGLHELAWKLAKSGDEASLRGMQMSFPTCALAVIALGKSWKDSGKVDGELKLFVTPKEVDLSS